jgi:hypothetical protein
MDILVLCLHWPVNCHVSSRVNGRTHVRRGILMKRGRELEPKHGSNKEMNLHGG